MYSAHSLMYTQIKETFAQQLRRMKVGVKRIAEWMRSNRQRLNLLLLLLLLLLLFLLLLLLLLIIIIIIIIIIIVIVVVVIIIIIIILMSECSFDKNVWYPSSVYLHS